MAERMRRANIAGGVGAGVGAAIVMMIVMGILRFTTNTASIPEILEGDLVRLTGGKIESIFINALGVGGKALLLVSIVEGTLLLGGLLGWLFARVWPIRAGARARGPAGLGYGLLIGLGLNLIVLPLFGQGFFGTASDAVAVTAPPNIATLIYGTDLAPLGLPQAVSMFIFGLAFGLGLVALLPWPKTAGALAPVTAPAGTTLDRREFVRAAGGVGLALVGGVGLWAAITRALQAPPTAGLVEVDLNAPTPTPAAVAQLPAETPPATVGTAPTDVPPPPVAGATEAPGMTEAPETPTTQPGGNTTSPPTAEMTEMPATEVPTAAPTQSAFAGVKPVLVPEITPTDTFYITTKNFIDPTVDANSWKLSFTGMVGNPYSLTLADLKKLPVVNRVETLACISNPVGGDLIGNTNWKGVDFKALLQKAQPQDGVVDILVRGADGYSDSFPLAAGLNNECVLVYEMNGQPLPQRHGFPARLLVPGIYGMKNCKWITEVQLVNYDYKGYWEGQGWSDTAPYQTMSRIDYPNGNQIPAKPIYIGGVAFAGNRGIKRVEVSTDGGKTWGDAQLRPPLGKYTWTQWVYPWLAPPGTYTLLVRATDGKGQVQTSQQVDTYPDGATGYHSRQVRVG